MTVDIKKIKTPSKNNLGVIISMLKSLSNTTQELKQQCINDYDETKTYSKGQACFYNNGMYEAKTTTTGEWNPNSWQEIDTTTVKYMTAEEIDALFNSISQETWDYLSNIISDTSITTTKTYSSSKIYGEIQKAIDSCNDYTLKQIAKKVTGSYKLANTIDDINDKSCLWLLKNNDTGNYDKIYVMLEDNTKEQVGNTTVDLNGYVKEEALNDYLKTSDADGKYVTQTSFDTHTSDTDIHITTSERTKWNSNSKDVYSTTEVKTNKVWINGKPIYRKVVLWKPGVISSYGKQSDYNITHNISNMDSPISCTVIAGNYIFPFITSNNSGFSGTAVCYFYKTHLVLRVNNDSWIDTTWYFTLEYTKTTD